MNTKSNKILSILLLLAGTLLVGFSMGRWLAPLAAWIGPVLIMRYARDHKVGRGYLLVIVAYILAFLIGFGAIWLGAGCRCRWCLSSPSSTDSCGVCPISPTGS